MEDDPRCRQHGQSFGILPKGVLYFAPPGEEVLENHKWLKFTVRKPLSEDSLDMPDTHQKHTRDHIPESLAETDRNGEQSEVRIRIWPNPRPENGNIKANCKTNDHEQELFGKMNQTTTFVLSTKQYLEGVCLQVEIEDEHRRWSKVKETMCEDYDVTFEGNGDDAEMNVAVAFVFVTFIGFSLAFLQLWFCLLKTGRFM